MENILLNKKYAKKISYLLRNLRQYEKFRIGPLNDEDKEICILIFNLLGYKYTLSNQDIIVDGTF